MKLLKVLGLSLVAASVAATSASAAPSTVLHIAGSTAFRAGITEAIVQTLASPVIYACDKGTGLSSALGCNYSVFEGNDGTTVECFWTGSLAGVTDLVARPNLAFPSNAAGNGLVSTGGKLPAKGSYTVDSAPPDVAMSDAYAASVASIIASGKLLAPIAGQANAALLSSLINHSSITDGGSAAGSANGPVGIVPFVWISGNTTGTNASPYNSANTVAPPFTNMTTIVAENLIVGGPTPISLFPGNTDANGAVDFAYLIGRNEDSGTRIDTFACCGAGLTPSSVNQLSAGFSSDFTAENDNGTERPTGGYSTTSGAISGISSIVASAAAGSTPANGSPASTAFAAAATDLFPADAINTEPNITWNAAGHSGYIAGGDVANVLSAYNPQNIYPNNAPSENSGLVYLIGYAGPPDAVKVSYGTILTYNGVACTPANVYNGTYTDWSLEHLYYLGGTNANKLTGAAKTLADTLADAIYNTYADTDSNGNHEPATATAALQSSAVVSTSLQAIPNTFDGTGLYLQDASVYSSTDGGTYNLNY